MQKVHVYDFVSKTITEAQTRNIIAEAGYAPGDYTYTRRVDNDGYVVRGDVVMSITRLENAAKALKIKVEIYSPITEAISSSDSYGTEEVAATLYQTTIVMEPDTVQQLYVGNYNLYAFKAVKTAIGGGAPVVWFRSQNYSANTSVKWSVQYGAYTSKSEIIANGEIIASFSTDIDLSETLQVISPTGIGTVVQSGQVGAISIDNQTTTPFTCGISQVVAGTANPMCAFPLFGKHLDVIVPIEKVLLMFSTTPVNTGTVVEQAYSSSVLIDLTGAPNNQRTVNYNINNGWDWGGFNWAHEYPANSNLVPLLIDNSASLMARRLLAQG